MDTRLPILVNAVLQCSLRLGKLARMRRGVVVMVCGGVDAFKVSGVSCLSALGE